MSIASLKQDLRDVPGIETLTMQMLAGRQNYMFAGRVVSLDASASDREVKEAIRASLTSDAIAQIPAGVPVEGGPEQAGAGLGLPAPAPFQAPPIAAQIAGASPAPAEAASPVSGTASATNNTAQSKGTESVQPSTPSPSAALIPQVPLTSPPATVQPKAPSMTAPSNPASHALTIKDVLTQHTDKLNQILEAQIAQLQATLSDQADTVVAGTNAVIQRSKQHTEDFKAVLGQFVNDLGA